MERKWTKKKNKPKSMNLRWKWYTNYKLKKKEY